MSSQDLAVATAARQLSLNPKLQAVSGLGELVDESIQALRDCLSSEDSAVKFAAAKFVMEKLVTPKAVHTFIDPNIAIMYEHQDRASCESMVEACARGQVSIEETQAYLEIKKIHTDVSRQQAALDQVARIKELEARRATLIIVKSGREQLEEAMK